MLGEADFQLHAKCGGNMTIAFSRGSEWRKWDLHLHTPQTRLNNGYTGGWTPFLEELARYDASVIGITNYFCFQDNELETVRGGLQKLGVQKTILGNLEFRIAQPNKNGEFINVHVLFSERLSTSEISRHIAKLRLLNTADPSGQRAIYCTHDDVNSAGLDFSKTLIDFSVLVEHLKSHFDRSDYLVGCCPSGYGNYRPARGEGRGAQLAIEIDKASAFAFGDAEDRSFFLNTSRYDGAIEKPVMGGSDAHKLDEVGGRYCWIKGHPTFEGLRQVLFEPRDRISLGANSPSTEFPKPYFSDLAMGGAIVAGEQLKYEDDELLLNPALVAIIGGRGTGKSVLLDSLYRRFHDLTSKDDNRLTQLALESFIVGYTKQGGGEATKYGNGSEGAITYLHVRQGDIRRIAESPDELSSEIKRLLGLPMMETQDNLGLDMEAILKQVADILRWLQLDDPEGNKINSKSFNEKIIKSNEERIRAITSPDNKALVEEFNKNAAAIVQARGASQRLVGLKAKLAQVAQDWTREIAPVNTVLSTYNLQIPQIDVQAQSAAIEEANARLAIEVEALTQKNSQIQQSLRAQGIEQDPAGLLEKVSVFQKAITEAKQRISDAETRTATLKELLVRRQEIAAALMDGLKAAAVAVDAAFKKLQAGREGWDDTQKSLVKRLLVDVEVKGEIVFDAKEFYEGLLAVLNGRKFRQTGDQTQVDRVRAKFNVSTYQDFVRLLAGEQVISGEDGAAINAEQMSRFKEFFVPYDKYSFLDYLYLPQWQQRYVRVRAGIKYKRKTPDRLSVGQRGTFYVCMKLATDPFGSPFVFDQPEDDLDNDFIMKELVPLFREIKKYRQIVIATHNANLVVNADAEQIIVAMNSEEVLSYKSGALEDIDIRSMVCEILEGGKDAFIRRENKYDFSQ
jgi:hypothetical protein